MRLELSSTLNHLFPYDSRNKYCNITRKQREKVILPRSEPVRKAGMIFLKSSGTGGRLPHGIFSY